MRPLTSKLFLVLALVLVTPAMGEGARTADLRGLVQCLNGSPTYLGKISATTSAKNNADTTAFTINKGDCLLIIPSAAVKVLGDVDATEDITTTTGVPLAASEKFVMLLRSNQNYLQAITDSSTSDVYVWRLE